MWDCVLVGYRIVHIMAIVSHPTPNFQKILNMDMCLGLMFKMLYNLIKLIGLFKVKSKP
jgi:hypothetical protein